MASSARSRPLLSNLSRNEPGTVPRSVSKALRPRGHSRLRLALRAVAGRASARPRRSKAWVKFQEVKIRSRGRLCQLGALGKGRGLEAGNPGFPAARHGRLGRHAPGGATTVVRHAPGTPRARRSVRSHPAIPADRTQRPKHPARPAPGRRAAHNSPWPQRKDGAKCHSETGPERGHAAVPKAPGVTLGAARLQGRRVRAHRAVSVRSKGREATLGHGCPFLPFKGHRGLFFHFPRRDKRANGPRSP